MLLERFYREDLHLYCKRVPNLSHVPQNRKEYSVSRIQDILKNEDSKDAPSCSFHPLYPKSVAFSIASADNPKSNAVFPGMHMSPQRTIMLILETCEEGKIILEGLRRFR